MTTEQVRRDEEAMRSELEDVLGASPTINGAVAQTRRRDFMARAEADRLGRKARAASVASQAARKARVTHVDASPGVNHATVLGWRGRSWLRRLYRLRDDSVGIS
jgi:hypothetical protein